VGPNRESEGSDSVVSGVRVFPPGDPVGIFETLETFGISGFPDSPFAVFFTKLRDSNYRLQLGFRIRTKLRTTKSRFNHCLAPSQLT
jgi:hypothetical protein